jgi:hypothetical protein
MQVLQWKMWKTTDILKHTRSQFILSHISSPHCSQLITFAVRPVCGEVQLQIHSCGSSSGKLPVAHSYITTLKK